MTRSVIANAKRIVIKIGSSSLTGSAGSELDSHAVQKIVDLAFHSKSVAQKLSLSPQVQSLLVYLHLGSKFALKI